MTLKKSPPIFKNCGNCTLKWMKPSPPPTAGNPSCNTASTTQTGHALHDQRSGPARSPLLAVAASITNATPRKSSRACMIEDQPDSARRTLSPPPEDGEFSLELGLQGRRNGEGGGNSEATGSMAVYLTPFRPPTHPYPESDPCPTLTIASKSRKSTWTTLNDWWILK